MRPLADLLPLELGGEVAHVDHELVEGAVDLHLFVSEVVEEPDAGIEEVLDEERRPVGVAAQARLVAHDDGIEGVALCRVEHRDQPGPLLELGATVIGVDEDVLGGECSALLCNIARSLSRLHIDRGGLVLFLATAGVESGAKAKELHDVPGGYFKMSTRRSASALTNGRRR
ncbi:hypothetical protein WMF44_22330 [Sorangium sp. So ce426]